MRMTVNLDTVQTVTPQMIASMAMLQCGNQELCDYLEELSYENPMMELHRPEASAPEAGQLADKLRWLKSSDRQNRSYYTDTEQDSVDQYLHADRSECLSDFVKEQILTLELSPDMRDAMETVAELLDERGLFTEPVQEIICLSGCDRNTAEEALARVRRLEPAGVAAGSIRDSLLVQLARLEPRRPLAERLISGCFSHLAVWSDHRIARELSVSVEAVRQAKRTIATLNPYPSNGFADREQIQYITPDLSIFPAEHGLQVTVEEQYLPSVHINAGYLKMLETQQDPEVRKYLRQKLEQLEQVIANMDRRKSTVLRCGEIVARRQTDFLSGGPLRKLTLRDVAEELELHESTISRAVKNKYIQCARGLLPMSAFFSRDAGRNYGVCRSSIQDEMLRIIDAENPQKPLSDEKIVAELEKRHILLSRRAVAKYRAELGVPPASARKHRTAI